MHPAGIRLPGDRYQQLPPREHALPAPGRTGHAQRNDPLGSRAGGRPRHQMEAAHSYTIKSPGLARLAHCQLRQQITRSGAARTVMPTDRD